MEVRPVPLTDRREDAALLCAFVNTRGILVDDPWAREELGDAEALGRWWAGRGVRVTADEEDARQARVVREGLRALMARNNAAGVPEDASAVVELGELTRRIPLTLTPGEDGGLLLTSSTVSSEAAAALADVLVAASRTQQNGAWVRLKVCADPGCREAFHDTTRNHSRTWCSMAVCGARAKQRAFSARHRGARAEGAG